MHPVVRDFATFFTPRLAPVDAAGEPGTSQSWRLEVTLARVRWYAVPVCLLTVLIFPAIPWPLLVLPGPVFGLGNLGVIQLLHQSQSLVRLKQARGLATGLDWVATTASIGAFSHEPAIATPAVLLLMVVTTTLRYGIRGLIGASGGALLIIAALMGVQVRMHTVLDLDQAAMILASWAVVLVVMLLVGITLLRSNVKRRHGAPPAEAISAGDPPVHPCNLSERERQLLPLLAQSELSYQQIAGLLFISPETVKTHVRRMGRKLGVSGRENVVATARERGWLSSEKP